MKRGRVHRQDPLDRETIVAKEPQIEIQVGRNALFGKFRHQFEGLFLGPFSGQAF